METNCDINSESSEPFDSIPDDRAI